MLKHLIIAHYQNLIAAGVQYFIVAPHCNDTETVQLFAEQVMPALVATSAAADRGDAVLPSASATADLPN